MENKTNTQPNRSLNARLWHSKVRPFSKMGLEDLFPKFRPIKVTDKYQKNISNTSIKPCLKLIPKRREIASKPVSKRIQ